MSEFYKGAKLEVRRLAITMVLVSQMGKYSAHNCLLPCFVMLQRVSSSYKGHQILEKFDTNKKVKLLLFKIQCLKYIQLTSSSSLPQNMNFLVKLINFNILTIDIRYL